MKPPSDGWRTVFLNCTFVHVVCLCALASLGRKTTKWKSSFGATGVPWACLRFRSEVRVGRRQEQHCLTRSSTQSWPIGSGVRQACPSVAACTGVVVCCGPGISQLRACCQWGLSRCVQWL